MSTYTDDELIQLYRTVGKNTNGMVVKDAKNAKNKLIHLWETTNAKTKINSRNDTQIEKVLEAREKIYELMKERNIFPQTYEDNVEEEGGLYPDSDDPLFLLKLLKKQEFLENKQPSVADSIRDGVDPCKTSSGFELSPTQRFIGQFLSPRTPYMSALLFHGVGVGKTCSAITVAENYLETYPRKQVIIVAPRNIQPNFIREIFNETKLHIGEGDEPNTYDGCTGNTYLKLTETEFSRDKGSIMSQINVLKSRRYQLVGYLAFYNHLKEILDREIKGLTEERKVEEKEKKLRELFSNRLIIIDEAHNVRDLSETDDDSADAPGGRAEVSESQAGKKLTPYLRKLLRAAEGTKLLLLTATPMYNTYKEIIPLLNLLLINDKKATISEADFFAADGTFLAGKEKKFGEIIQPYVSFMRGENPLAFPIRLEPKGLPRVTQWPKKDPLGNSIEDEKIQGSEVTIRKQIVKLPFVTAEHTGQGLADYRAIVGSLIVSSGLRLGSTDGLVQAGNFLFPSSISIAPESRIREQGFKSVFQEMNQPRQYKIISGISPTWLYEDTLQQYSPKCNTIVKRLRTTTGVTFIFSRFVFSGALSIALALEANGYENASRPTGYLKDAVLAPGGKQCAYCDKKQATHAGADHEFKQAKYVILTGRDDLTPNNKGSIEQATRVENKDGGDVKVIIGSQVASEGIDLKFIREVIVFDSWWHLNKLEQVIGRGIRFCSHSALEDIKKRNCTVILLLTTFPATQEQETIDMFQYREGFKKAFQIGMITRVMKRYAIDCNLNKEAIVMSGLDDVDVMDSQGDEYKHSINDVGYTSVCDWIQTCDYTCGTSVDFKSKDFKVDTGTYDEYAARWRAHEIKERLRLLFKKQAFYHSEDLLHLFDDIPPIAAHAILRDVIDNRTFRITVKNESGYIVYKNGFFMFQPVKLRDTGIPLAYRAALFPVKQDSYEEFEEAAIVDMAPQIAPSHPAAVGVGVAAAAAVVGEQQEQEEVEQQVGAVETVVEFWGLFSTFLDSIQNGDLPPVTSEKMLPEPIETALRNRYSGNKNAFARAYNSVSMVSRLYRDIHENEEWRDSLASAFAKYIWDEILTPDEQYALYTKKKTTASPFLQTVWKEHLISFDGEIIYRRVNASTGRIEYICNGVACSPTLVAALEAEDESTDPIRKFRANTTTMGNPYGTINYKKGIFVFKTNAPVSPSSNPVVREKQERGSECAIVANMIPHYNLLEELGTIAQESIGTTLGFTLSELRDAQAPRGVKNSTRACALTDMALRFFDELKLQGKRWLLRPLSTFYTKHPGILQKRTT